MPWVRMIEADDKDGTIYYCAGCTKKFERVGEVGYLMYDGTYFCVACAFMGMLDVLDDARRQQKAESAEPKAKVRRKKK